MKALWIAMLLALVPFAALAQTHYSYVEVHHQGSQDKPPPTLWLGTQGHVPSIPSFWYSGNQDPYLDNSDLFLPSPIILEGGQYQAVLGLTRQLPCQGRLHDFWTDLTVTTITDGRITSVCIIECDAARDYVKALDQIPGVASSNLGDEVRSLSLFLGDPGTPSPPLSADDGSSWIEFHHSPSPGMPGSAVWLGSLDALPPQGDKPGVTRLIVSDRQYLRASLVKLNTACEYDEKKVPSGMEYITRIQGHGRDDELEMTTVSARGPWPCVMQGPYVCATLHSLADVFIPEADLDNRKTIKAMADRFGCRADLWLDLAPSEFWTVNSPGAYIVIKPGGWDYTGSRIWVGSENGMPDIRQEAEAGRTDDKPANRLYISQARYDRLIKGAILLPCQAYISEVPEALMITVQDGFRSSGTCQLKGAAACDYLRAISALATSDGVVATRLRLYGKGLNCA